MNSAMNSYNLQQESGLLRSRRNGSASLIIPITGGAGSVLLMKFMFRGSECWIRNASAWRILLWNRRRRA